MQSYQDLIAILITAFAVALSWCIALGLKKIGLKGRVTRNFLHFVAGLWGLLWLNFQSHWIASLIAFLAVLTLMVVLFWKKFSFLNTLAQPFSCDHDGKWGVLLFAFSLFLITLLFWDKKSMGTAVIFSLSLGDGLADAVGSRFGRTPIHLPWNRKKTVEGGLACFLGATVAIYSGFWLTGHPLPLHIPLLGGVICAIVEALSPSELDNLLISVFLSAFLFLVS